MSFDITGVASTLAAVAIAGATVSTAVISINTQRAANRLAKQQAAQAEAAKQAAEEVAVTLAESTNQTQAKLDTIHTLVNSNLTTALQNELDGARREVVLLNASAHTDPEAIALAKARIAELQAQLNERSMVQAATTAAAGVTTTTVTTTK